MKFTDNGLVLRQVKTGESNRIITLLTEKHGIVSVFIRGGMRPNNKLFSASELFAFSEWTLRKGKNLYWADEATTIEMFFGLRDTLDGISLAAYIAELLQTFYPSGDEGAVLLQLALNCFYLLAEKKREPLLVKAVFELRTLSETGFMPEISGCVGCGCAAGKGCAFDVANSVLYCSDCAAERNLSANIDVVVLKAMQFIIYAEPQQLFNFSIPPEALQELAHITERYLLYQLDYPPRTLDYLNTILHQ